MSIYLPYVNSEEYEIIFTNVETKCGIVLRSEKGPIACKKSQLIYIIIALMWKYIVGLKQKPQSVLIAFAREVNRLFDICVSDRYPAVQEFSLNGQPILPFIPVNDLSFLSRRRGDIKIYTMGLVHTNPSVEWSRQFPNGVINHYFLIVNNGQNEFFIISSYGSDVVKIGQKITLLDLREFQNIINAFNGVGSIEEKNNYIIDFFYKYFLPDGMTVYSRDEGSGKKLVHTPKKGASLEVSDYLFKESGYQKECKFFYFPEFVDNIANIISDNVNERFLGTTGGKKIRKTKKYKQFKRTKRNKTLRRYKRYKK